MTWKSKGVGRNQEDHFLIDAFLPMGRTGTLTLCSLWTSAAPEVAHNEALEALRLIVDLGRQL